MPSKKTSSGKPDSKQLTVDHWMTFKVTELKEKCKELGLSATGTKSVLCDRLAEHYKSNKKSTKKETKVEPKKTSKKVEPSQDFDYDNCESYKLVELKDQCKQLGLATSGTKSALCDRLREHNGEDVEESEESEEPESEESDEEELEREEEEEEEQRDSDNEFNFDECESYKLTELKDKSKELGLPVSGTKSAICDRLRKHNKAQSKPEKKTTKQTQNKKSKAELIIEEWIKNGGNDEGALELNELELTELPNLPEDLEVLDCGRNKLTSLPKLPKNLKVLNCGHNKLTSLPSLPKKLERLYCNNNKLTSLQDLPKTLEQLYCSNNKLTNIQTLPKTLAEFSCEHNQLTSLPDLPEDLLDLVCNDNQLTRLPDLPELEILNYNNNPKLKLTKKQLDVIKKIESVNVNVESKVETESSSDSESSESEQEETKVNKPQLKDIISSYPRHNISIYKYKRGILVVGDTKEIKDQLKALKGVWNKPLNGWIFPKDKLSQLKELFQSESHEHEDQSDTKDIDIMRHITELEKDDLIEYVDRKVIPIRLQKVFENTDSKNWRYIAEIYVNNPKLDISEISEFLKQHDDEYKFFRKLINSADKSNLIDIVKKNREYIGDNYSKLISEIKSHKDSDKYIRELTTEFVNNLKPLESYLIESDEIQHDLKLRPDSPKKHVVKVSSQEAEVITSKQNKTFKNSSSSLPERIFKLTTPLSEIKEHEQESDSEEEVKTVKRKAKKPSSGKPDSKPSIYDEEKQKEQYQKEQEEQDQEDREHEEQEKKRAEQRVERREAEPLGLLEMAHKRLEQQKREKELEDIEMQRKLKRAVYEGESEVKRQEIKRALPDFITQGVIPEKKSDELTTTNIKRKPKKISPKDLEEVQQEEELQKIKHEKDSVGKAIYECLNI